MSAFNRDARSTPKASRPNEAVTEAAKSMLYDRRLSRVKLGYSGAAVLFALAIVTWILAIMASSGAAGGVGAMFCVAALVTAVVTGMYHNLSDLWREQQRERRSRRGW